MVQEVVPVTDDKRKRDEESGRYTDKYPPEDIQAAIRDLSGTAATSEVADELDCARDTAYKKLMLMEERGQVVSRLAGGIRVWSIAEDRELE